jgi:uncharacterized repeat protein (TIGR04138 family)
MSFLMNFRDELARIIARDPRYTIEGYAFILEALDQARTQKLSGKRRNPEQERSSQPARETRSSAPQSSKPRGSGHVTGSELCEAVRRLAKRQFGLLAATVLTHWGVRSTSDIGEIVYNLIAAGDLEKTSDDARSDFDNVFDFETAFHPRTLLAADDAVEEPR